MDEEKKVQIPKDEKIVETEDMPVQKPKKKVPITEEMLLHEQWFSRAEEIDTIEDFVEFAEHLLNDYEHDYGTVCHAIAALALAGAWLGSNTEKITAFQAQFVMWDFITYWNFANNTCGLKLVNYDDMLYPQYAYKFDKVISKDIWNSLQKQAKKNLETRGYSAIEVVQHWKNIANGIVPFGYKVEDN